MKYIEKTLTDSEGYDITCHVAVGGSFNLVAQSGGVQVKSWKDVVAFNEGKVVKRESNVPVDLTTLTATCGEFPAEMTVYESLWTVLAMRLIGDPSSEFYGGVLKDTNEQ
jgi:hypothetical protein